MNKDLIADLLQTLMHKVDAIQSQQSDLANKVDKIEQSNTKLTQSFLAMIDSTQGVCNELLEGLSRIEITVVTMEAKAEGFQAGASSSDIRINGGIAAGDIHNGEPKN